MSFKFFQVIKAPTAELLEILNNNIIGTPGQGMLYQHLGVKNKINKIADPYYVNLVRNNSIIGTGCFCNRLTENNGQNIRAFYIRYFSFKEKYRRKQASQKKNKAPNRILRKEIKSLLSGHGLETSANEKFYHYAYVDPRNLRSVLLCDEFGFEPIRQFSTIIFNRVNPQDNKRAISIFPTHESEVKEKLKKYYEHYNMFSFENLFNERKYYVMKEKDEIVAGVSVNPEHWKIHSMPGLTGNLILNSFSFTPILNRLFNRDYHFLTLEGIYCKPGFENYLEILFEALLKKYRLNSAMIWVDSDSALYKTLKSLNLGLVDKLNKEVRADVICKFINFDEKEKAAFRTNPSYISGIDLT